MKAPMMSHPSSEAEPDPLLDLHRRWLGGDRDALEELLRRIQPWIRNEISKVMTDDDRVGQDSLDLAQTAVLNYLKARLRFLPKNGRQLCALFRRIAYNELIDTRRRSRHGRIGPFESLRESASMSTFSVAAPSSARPDRQAEQSSDRDWVRLALQFLTADERRLLIAREVEGTDWATIARDFGAPEDDPVSANTVRMRCERLKPRVANIIRKLRAGSLPEEA
jgi:RNA polymerase sigma factor (sigma-70 family)